MLLTNAFALSVSAAGSSRMQVDAFGNPLCMGGEEDSGSPADHSKLPTCCTIGCTMGSSVTTSPDADATVALVWHTDEDDVVTSVETVLPPKAAEHDPGSPRAPPLTA